MVSNMAGKEIMYSDPSLGFLPCTVSPVFTPAPRVTCITVSELIPTPHSVQIITWLMVFRLDAL